MVDPLEPTSNVMQQVLLHLSKLLQGHKILHTAISTTCRRYVDFPNFFKPHLE